MVALLTYPTRIESAAFQKRTANGSVSHRICELHRVIANPTSDAADVKRAKRRLLRTLGKARIFERPILAVSAGQRKKGAAGQNDRGLVATTASSNREEKI